MWQITVIALGVVGISFGISHFIHCHKAKSHFKDHIIGETVAITAVLIWVTLMLLMAFGVIEF